MVWPDVTLITLCIVVAIFSLMWGTALLFSAIFDGSHLLPRWIQFLLGAVGIGFGIFFLIEPETKIDQLLTLLGILALAGAAMFFLSALQLLSAHGDLKAKLGR
jgi:uncharacterized membrane protein HdeD (DUF308 family)